MKDHIQNRIREFLGDEELPFFLDALKRLAENPRKSLRLSRRLGATESLLAECGIQLEGKVPWAERAYYFDRASFPNPGHHPLVAAGLVYIQEASAMEGVELLDVQPGMKVLDLCAAPGGKSTQILDHLVGEGFLVSNELNRERVKKLDAMLSRWGYLNVAIVSLDGEKAATTFSGAFDRVLIDAPCSSESFFAKRKDHRKDVSEKESLQFSRIQKVLIEQGFRALKAGGRMVYSTCTYSRLENEDVIEFLLMKHADAIRVEDRRRWPHRDDMPGGFLSVIEKKSGGDLSICSSSSISFARSGDLSSWIDQLKSLSERVRVGDLMWNGLQNHFAAVMAGNQGKSLYEADLSLETAEAVRYLQQQWDGDRSKKKCRILWRGFPIGLFQYGKGIHSYVFPKSL